jgi:hypothetical protein
MSADRTSCQACPVGHTSKVRGVVGLVGWGGVGVVDGPWAVEQGPGDQHKQALLSLTTTGSAVLSSMSQHAD